MLQIDSRRFRCGFLVVLAAKTSDKKVAAVWLADKNGFVNIVGGMFRRTYTDLDCPIGEPVLGVLAPGQLTAGWGRHFRGQASQSKIFGQLQEHSEMLESIYTVECSLRGGVPLQRAVSEIGSRDGDVQSRDEQRSRRRQSDKQKEGG